MVKMSEFALRSDILARLGYKRSVKPVFELGRYRLPHFRLAYAVALEKDMFTEAERVASARCVFEAIVEGNMDGTELDMITSDMDELRSLVRRQLTDELGLDPLSGGAAPSMTERMAPPRAEDPYELLRSHYGESLVCPSEDDTSFRFQDGSNEFKGASLDAFRLLWKSKWPTLTPRVVRVMMETAYPGTLYVYGPSSPLWSR